MRVRTMSRATLSMAVAVATGVVLLAASPASASVGEASTNTTVSVAQQAGASDTTIGSTTDGFQWATHAEPAAGSLTGCTNGYYVEICFEKYGDKIWVRNTNLLESEYGHYSNWLRDSSGTWTFWRNGNCGVDYDGWGYCNKDFYEDSSSNAYGGEGSGVRLYPCDFEVGCTTYYSWVRNNG